MRARHLRSVVFVFVHPYGDAIVNRIEDHDRNGVGTTARDGGPREGNVVDRPRMEEDDAGGDADNADNRNEQDRDCDGISSQTLLLGKRRCQTSGR